MSLNGTYRNPAEKSCWETCQACFRCEAKGSYSKCQGCSGRFDLNGRVDPHPDDMCRCREGILQYVKETGQMVQVRYKRNPYKGEVIRAETTQDERDWDNYIGELRERFEDETYDPIQVTDR